MKYKIAREMSFEASHRLMLNYKSPCQGIHGHSYKILIIVSTDKLNRNGMVFDFGLLKNVEKWIDTNWDHALILSQADPILEIKKALAEHGTKITTFPYINVTAELMAQHLYYVAKDMIKEFIDRPFKLKIKVWETQKNSAIYGE